LQVLSGLIHCEFLPQSEFAALRSEFRRRLRVRTQNVGAVHGAVLGLCAFVAAFPHQVPDFLPELLLYLGTFISARQPVSGI
jgi:proteasome activator subunit 4